MVQRSTDLAAHRASELEYHLHEVRHFVWLQELADDPLARRHQRIVHDLRVVHLVLPLRRPLAAPRSKWVLKQCQQPSAAHFWFVLGKEVRRRPRPADRPIKSDDVRSATCSRSSSQ